VSTCAVLRRRRYLQAIRPVAVRAGATVIDNSSAFRMTRRAAGGAGDQSADVARSPGDHRQPQLLRHHFITPLWPIHRANRIRRLLLATYQSAPRRCGRDARATRVHARVSGRREYNTSAAHLTHSISSATTQDRPGDGYNEEETRSWQETRKIFGDADMRVSATCVRVPVLRAHSWRSVSSHHGGRCEPHCDLAP